jgi:hypothetical protein
VDSQFRLPFPKIETFFELTESCTRAYTIDFLTEDSKDVGKCNFCLIINIADKIQEYKSFFTLHETVLNLEQSKQ